MELTKENFAQATGGELILVDFWAPWCGPCRAMMPVLEEFEKQSGVKVGKVNVDEQGELAGQFRVMSIPTFVWMKEGKVVDMGVGGQPLQNLLDTANKLK